MLHPFDVEPSNLLECGMKFRRLVDVNTSGLLSMGLSKLLFVVVVELQSAVENATLAGEIGRAVKSQLGRNVQLTWVEKVPQRVVTEIHSAVGTLPLDPQRLG